jgi:hypothetical protein
MTLYIKNRKMILFIVLTKTWEREILICFCLACSNIITYRKGETKAICIGGFSFVSQLPELGDSLSPGR